MTLDLATLPIFPCKLDKKPLTANGFYDASVGADYSKWPLVGLATGAVSGIDVLDVDPGGLAWLAENEHRLPPTRRHRTRRGGVHLLFQSSPGLRCSKGWIAKGVDVRSEGGYAILWNLAGLPVIDLPIAGWPGWLLEVLVSRGDGHSVKGHTGQSAPVGVSDHDECEPVPTSSLKLRSKAIVDRVARTQPGERNNMLFWGAKRHRELIAEGRMKHEVAVMLLVGAAKINGLWRDGDTPEEQADAPAKVMATIESGIARGMVRWKAYQTQGREQLIVCPRTDADADANAEAASFLDRT